MTKERLQELQTEIARLQEIDNKTTERVAFELELETLKKNHEQYVLENATPLDLDLFDKEYDKAYNALVEKYNIVPCSKELDMDPYADDPNLEVQMNQDEPELDGAGFDSEGVNHYQEKLNIVPCSKELDMEWANESENIQ
jgi:hypothetical protein